MNERHSNKVVSDATAIKGITKAGRKGTKPEEPSRGSHELRALSPDDYLQSPMTAEELTQARQHLLAISTKLGLLDASGEPIEMKEPSFEGDTRKEIVTLTIPREQFEQLSFKTQEILALTARAQERIAKDQEEINLLKTETRETLRRLRAA